MMSRETDNEALARAVQKWLGVKVDGWGGAETMRAFNERTGQAAETGVHALSDPAAFFAAVRAAFGPLSQSQVDGFNHLLSAMKAWPVEWAAYGLATVWHETAATMQPIAEYGKGKGRPYGKPGKHNGQVAYGRGYPQLTWDYNYKAVDKGLGLNGALIQNYEMALDPDISARALVFGMETGLFTGRGLKSYPLGHYTDYRRIINGTDKAAQIAGYAVKFENALRAGGW